METKNSVFIGTSLDGYIADENSGLDWLDLMQVQGLDSFNIPLLPEIQHV